VFSVHIPLLKPHCSESSKLLYAIIWCKLLQISLTNTSEKHYVFVTEFYDWSYKNKPQAKHGNLAARGIRSKPICWEDKMSQNGISSHGMESGRLFKKHPGVEYKFKGVFKPKTNSWYRWRNRGELNNDPTKQENIIEVGGPGKSLDRI